MLRMLFLPAPSGDKQVTYGFKFKRDDPEKGIISFIIARTFPLCFTQEQDSSITAWEAAIDHGQLAEEFFYYKVFFRHTRSIDRPVVLII